MYFQLICDFCFTNKLFVIKNKKKTTKFSVNSQNTFQVMHKIYLHPLFHINYIFDRYLIIRLTGKHRSYKCMVHSFSYDIDVSFSSIVDFTQKIMDNFIFFDINQFVKSFLNNQSTQLT